MRVDCASTELRGHYTKNVDTEKSKYIPEE